MTHHLILNLIVLVSLLAAGVAAIPGWLIALPAERRHFWRFAVQMCLSLTFAVGTVEPGISIGWRIMNWVALAFCIGGASKWHRLWYAERDLRLRWQRTVKP